MIPSPAETSATQWTPTPSVDGVSSLEHTLTEIRSGRRLEKLVGSVESFLNSQVSRLDKAMAECNQAIENDRIVQKILSDFEVEKLAWEKDRQAEIKRLQKAGEELIAGWEKLEDERRNK